jgi:plastocyanin
MSDNFFEPPCIAISSTQQISLTNAGNILHNFSVADGDIDVDVESGEEATTDETGTDLSAGTYRFYCKYHEGDGMVGTLVVE